MVDYASQREYVVGTMGDFHRILSIASAAAVVVACGARPEYPGCGEDQDCHSGEVCAQKRCVQCATDAHCGARKRCFSGACLTDNRCKDDYECTDGKVCIENECSSCTADRQCGTFGRCQDGECLSRGLCEMDEDCEDEELCVDGKCEYPGATAKTPTDCELTAIYFPVDGFSLSGEHKQALEQVAECLQRHTDRTIFVEGHTDPRGTEEHNIALSEVRAKTAAGYLRLLGVEDTRLRVIPRGETESTGEEPDGWKNDRRVQFEWQ